MDKIRNCLSLATEAIELITALIALGILLAVYNRLPFALDLVIGGVK